MAEITVQRRLLSSKVWPRPVVLVSILGMLAFLALPWPLEHKAHVILHGLCAQRPSHTYYFGDRPLPFDARMTGIYIGFLVTMIVLLANGAHRWCRPPSATRIAALMTLGGAMAADGFNSLLRDLVLPHPYQPQNWLRIVTGAGAGIVLAVALCFLLSVTLWRTVNAQRQTLESWTTLIMAAVVATPLLLISTSGIGPFYAPTVLVLVFAALAALTTLSLVVIVIVRKMEYRFSSAKQIEAVVIPAFVLALGIMLGLSIGRTYLERWLGTSTLT